MECLDAQRLVSAALDRDSVPGPELEQAKEHCRLCPDCTSVMRTLVAVQRSPLPEPPSDLADRIIATVRAEPAAVSAENLSAVSDRPAAPVPTPDDPAMSWHELKRRLFDPRNRRALVAWTATAAVVFVLTGVGALGGMRTIMTPGTRTSQMVSTDGGYGDQYYATPETGSDAALEAAPAPGQDAAESLSIATGLITVNGSVYRLAGEDPTVQVTDLTEVGRTRSNLGGAAPRDRRVLSAGDPARVFIEEFDSRLLAFDRVTRSHQGRTYVLQGGALDSFADPVTLPDGIGEPTSPDGSPTFVRENDDPTSEVFVRVGSDALTGIALAPGSDPALSPGWTWWTPAQ